MVCGAPIVEAELSYPIPFFSCPLLLPLLLRPPPHPRAAWKQFMGVARPFWSGDKKRTAWGLLALLIALMVCETQLAVMLIDKTGEMTSALAARQADRFWAAVRTS